MPDIDRRLAAVWFADIVGFTTLADSDEDAALDLCATFAAPGSTTSIRIGLHVGEVAGAPDGDLYGDGVNLAARIQAAAGPGEVVVSEDAARALRHSRGFRFDALGPAALKGYPDPVPLFRARTASPLCDPLRGDPRFAAFLASIGLAEVPLPVEEHAR